MTAAALPTNLGHIVFAERVIDSESGPRRALGPLAISIALVMSGSGMVLPVLARRLGELGAGVGALGLTTAAFALAQLVAAPLLGTLADRTGRRPVLLVGLAASVVANVGFLLARSVSAFVAVRTLEGVLEAGLVPSALGMVAATVPEHRRARWIGIVMGSMGAGLVAGPLLGGWLHDAGSSRAVFLTAAAAGALGLLLAFFAVPETRTLQVRRREELRRRWAAQEGPAQDRSFRDILPRPYRAFAALLAIELALSFAYAFAEPQMIFHFYDELGWSTFRFGSVAAVYGLAMVAGQVVLGGAADRLGRKPVILTGLVLFSSLFAGLILLDRYLALMAVAALAGLGGALTMNALSSFFLDITPAESRSRVMGLKRSASSLGSVAGPLLVAGAAALLSSRGIFLIAGAMVLATAFVAAAVLREPARSPRRTGDIDLECFEQRALAAQSTLRGILVRADTVAPRDPWRAQRRPLDRGGGASAGPQ